MSNKISNYSDGINVDPKYLIRLATHDKMSWNILEMLLEDLISTLAKSKQVIKLLIQELQTLHSKLKEKHFSIEEMEIDEIHSEINLPEDPTVSESSGERDELDPTGDLINLENDAVLRINHENKDYDNGELVEDETKLFEYVKDCLICGERFLTLDEYYNHKVIHGDFGNDGESYFDGSNNEKYLSVTESPEEHITQDSVINPTKLDRKLLQCEICFKRFERQVCLNQHKKIHTGQKPFQCQTCEKRFFRSEHLKLHVMMHRGEKPHQCKFCPKSFTASSNLKRHVKTHTGERPHQCKTCDKRFIVLRDLRWHEKIHSGNKPHSCKTCDKTFIRPNELRKHEMIHSGDKPFQCKSCSKRFTRHWSLKTHKRFCEQRFSTQI